MNIEEMRNLSPPELAKQLDAAQQELLDLRFRRATKQLVNHRLVSMTRKGIARIKTIMREKELGIR